jgi:DNA-binding SARP family transcriptional activator/tetratricopeptide (TPR) repeat protein
MPRLEVQLLGAPVVRVDQRELRFRTRKTLALLAVLVTSPGAQRREALSSLLWAELEADAARRELRKTLSYLTTALEDGAGWLVATRETLALQRDAFTSDVDELEEVARLEDVAAEARLEGMVRAYRGEFMLGFDLNESGFAEWLREKRESGRRSLGLVARALTDLHIASGNASSAVRTAETWVRLDPATETAHQALMRSHLEAGNAHAALEAFEACRAALARELEASPNAETRRIATSARLALGFSAPSSIVGRAAEWNTLERASLEGGVGLILGEPGIGKTRLALEFAGAHGEPFLLWAEEGTNAAPLAPIALALRSSLSDPARRARLEALETVWRTEIARLVPEFGTRYENALELTHEGRTRLIEGLLRGLFAALGPHGVLVLDDLHRFDVDSAELALVLTRRTGGMTLACARAPELEANTAVKHALENFERFATITRLSLEPLNPQELSALVGSKVDATHLHRITGGNPLYALEAARHPDPLEATRGVLELVRRRVRRLGEPVQRLLEAASLCGESFDPSAVQRAAGLNETQSLEATERALEAALIVDHATGQRFSHALIRQALADGLSAERQRRLHRRLARDATESGRIAEHLELGGSSAEAIPHRLRAAADAVRLHAYRLAIHHQNRALEDGLDDVGFASLFEPRYRLFLALADWVNLERELERFETVAMRLGQPEVIARVEMGWTDFHFRVGRYSQAIDRATRLLRQPLPASIEAMVRYERGVSQLSLARYAEAERDCADALECAPITWTMRGWVLNTLAISQSARGAFSQALLAVDSSETWFRAIGDRHGIASADRVTAPILAAHGHLEHALECLKRALRTAQEIQHVFLERAILETTVKVHLGRYRDAANAGVNYDEDDFFQHATRADLERALPWMERCLERAKDPFDAFLEPLWRNRLTRARWLVSSWEEVTERVAARA